jgi:hypothetical protein
MPTTTNYGWTTPADTDLVKDGASAIRTLGTAIDTTVFNNASAAIAKTIVDAKGDIIAATAADTVSRLAVGANDTVLTADSSTATGLKWAASASGGMTLLSTTSLSGATTTISNISQSYNDLKIIVYGVTNATANGRFRIAPNSSSGISCQTWFADYGGSVSTNWRFSQNNYLYLSSDTANNTRDAATNAWEINISQYSSTSTRKPYYVTGVFDYATDIRPAFFMGGINSTSAISSLQFSNSGGDLSTGTVLIYGVK